MEGDLDKWTNYLSGWQKRHCLIKGDIFYYFQKKGDMLPKAKVHLSVAKVEDTDKSSSKFELDTGCLVYYLRAKDLHDKKSWINAIKTAKLSAEKALKNDTATANKDDKSILKKTPADDKSSFHTRLARLSRYSANINFNAENIFKHITATYDLGQDETSVELLKLLSNHRNETGIFNEEISHIIKNLKEFSTSLRSLNNFLNEDNSSLEEIMIQDSKERSSAEYKVSIGGIEEGKIVKKNSLSGKNDIIFYDAEDEFNSEVNTKDKAEKNNSNLIKVTTMKDSRFYDPVYFTYSKRNRLDKKRLEVSINLWSVLKDAVGKDLNKFSVPVYFNEPISMLQRLAENFQYADLLNKAAKEKNSYIQLAYIAAFNIAGHSLNPNRTLKPFNPLLLETYELVDKDIGFRYFAEQVCHHPAVSACFVEGEDYTFYTNSNTKQNFYLTKGTFEVTNLGRSFFNVLSTNTSFSFNRPKVVIRNIIIGKISVDFVDTFTVTNHNTGDICEITIYPTGEPNKTDVGYFKGVVKTYLDEDQLTIEGSWNSHFDITYKGEKKRIWEKYTNDTKENYYFTDFSSNLNYLPEELKKYLPPTDSRFRPDQIAMENNDFDSAAKEKLRLEEKQRKKRKDNEKNKHYKHNPMYFTETYDDLTGELIYKYNGQYWEDRKVKNYGHFPDLY